MGIVGDELYRLGREMRISAGRIEVAVPESRLPTGLRGWADRLDAAAALSALRLSIAKGGKQISRRLGERLGPDVEVG